MPDVPVRIDDNVTILIETDEPQRRAGAQGFRAVNPVTGLAERLVDGALPFEMISGAVQAVAGQLVNAMDALPERPDKVKVDFGIKLSGDANILIAKGSGEANLKLTMEWSNAPKPAGAGG